MVEYLLQDLEEKVTEENKQHKSQEKEYQKQASGMKNSQMPKVGSTNFGGFKTPKIPTPKIPRI